MYIIYLFSRKNEGPRPKKKILYRWLGEPMKYIYNMLLRDGGETAAAGRGKERDIQTREAQ